MAVIGYVSVPAMQAACYPLVFGDDGSGVMICDLCGQQVAWQVNEGLGSCTIRGTRRACCIDMLRHDLGETFVLVAAPPELYDLARYDKRLEQERIEDAAADTDGWITATHAGEGGT